MTTGALVVSTLPFLAPLFAGLPKPVLSAVIIDAVVFGMMTLPEMRHLRRVSRADFWIAVAAIVGVLATGVVAGVIIGVVLSVVWLVHMSAHPSMPLLGRVSPTQAFRSLEDYPGGERYPGVVVLGFDAGLHFASAASLEDRVRVLVSDAEQPVHGRAGLRGRQLHRLAGASTVGDVLDFTWDGGAQLRLARVKRQVRSLLERDGVVDRIGPAQFYDTIYEAAVDRVGATPGPGDGGVSHD